MVSWGKYWEMFSFVVLQYKWVSEMYCPNILLKKESQLSIQSGGPEFLAVCVWRRLFIVSRMYFMF